MALPPKELAHNGRCGFESHRRHMNNYSVELDRETTTGIVVTITVEMDYAATEEGAQAMLGEANRRIMAAVRAGQLTFEPTEEAKNE